MKIFVQTLTGTTIELDVEANDTIADVKGKIQVNEGTPVDRQMLLSNERELKDGVLVDHNVRGGSMLEMLPVEKSHPAATISASVATTSGSPWAQLLARDAKTQARLNDNSSGFVNWPPLWQVKAMPPRVLCKAGFFYAGGGGGYFRILRGIRAQNHFQEKSWSCPIIQVVVIFLLGVLCWYRPPSQDASLSPPRLITIYIPIHF